MVSNELERSTAELAILSVLDRQPLHGYEISRRIEHDSGGALRFTLAALDRSSIVWRIAAGSAVIGKPATTAVAAAATNCSPVAENVGAFARPVGRPLPRHAPRRQGEPCLIGLPT